ncbi:MAG: 1-deoxy-D-xylulose-5-phosphate synthase [Planctomycetaceae bacterium]|jgi:1-deoxy-D-xylulose-5-phosphate synthase|nr:1-deoxy-D-xylulose-5-phosphate synthase [Planctomycetaceae bacterium]
MSTRQESNQQPILPTLKSPLELEQLSLDDLNRLAAEIRNELCCLHDHRSVHFASNLGVVELAIALHSVFDFSQDRLIWDTGHQISPHKLLTGRFQQFSTIRTKGGLMGFPNPAESEYDLMMTGHAGCSVGAILGLCCGDELLSQESNSNYVAVIGDGAFGNGAIYEAMSHAGGLQKNITVVLNDNKMSICPRVGGLANHLDGLRIHPKYSRLKQKLHGIVDRLPVIGGGLDSLLRRVKNTVKAGLLGEMLFESLGFRYVGPIDGHNIARLQRFLRMARDLDEPVLLHIFTEKGRGFQPAEDNPTEYHAPKPATRTPSPVSETKTFTEHARNAIDTLMYNNPKVCVITAAMCQGNMLETIREKYPDRFFDVGICESHAVVFAAGLAKSEMVPIVDIYSTFLQRAYDQIFQEASLQNLPIIFAVDRGGLAGADGPTHHGVFDLAYLRPFPNLTIMAPADAWDIKEMFLLAERLKGPSAIRYPRATADKPKRQREPLQLGKAERVRRGTHGTIAVCGAFVDSALEAADILNKEGIDVGVVNVRFVKPLDTETLLEPIRKGQFLVTLEEGILAGGFGSAVLEAANEERLDTRRVYRLGVPDRYVEHGERSEQLDDLGLTRENLVKVCRELK